ncbi:hypothetical protein ABZU86_03495 [Streptomyces sp. NPDC005271]|uniref:hypothetical protein n=1 Tax=unclassified Streptomyces TaxID=2593676 RepID=UPI0033B170F4
MNAPAAPAAPLRERRHPGIHAPRLHPSASWVVPLVLGVVFGGWAIFIDHNQGSSLLAAGILGLVAAVVVGAVCYAVGRVQSPLMPELRAALYGTVLGCALGFLYSVSGASVYRASGVGLGVGLAMTAMAYYVFHMRAEDAED